MKTLRVVLNAAGLAVILGSGTLTPIAGAASQPHPLIDFQANSRDRNGTVFHEYEYTYGDWQKHAIDLPRRGLLIQAPSGKGGVAQGRSRISFHKHPLVRLHYLIGNENKAQSVVFALEDGDGTAQVWTIPLAGLERGREFGFRLDLAKPTREDAPGKKPGLDLKRIDKWEVKGDWSDPAVEVLFIALHPDSA